MGIIIRNCEDFGYKFTVLVCVKMLQHIPYNLVFKRMRLLRKQQEMCA